ncbi:serine/threonine-protein kinase [Parafrankia discariae]|uniref:serine/threonine-protein kinase n=1 Tax=Parafrankia discariae TaxID=365528 RepID=UPI000373AB87|nr:serine/threonine-protein kinase [Parafrankia discariae]
MRRLGSQYVLHAPLGRGATGEVWRGEREADGTAVAAKILRAELADDSDVVERFLRERELLLGFDHPHLVKVRDLVAEGGGLAIVMDLVDGVDLRKYLRARDVLAPREAVSLLGQVLDALAAVHRAGVVHRDIKPDNILIDTTDPDRPRAMLTDFGIARLAHGPSMTRLTGLIGTPRYMAPELSEGTRATPAADLYSIGIVLYELLAGRPPFNADHPIAMLRAHLEQTPPPLEELPGTLWATIARLLAKAPADRPATAGLARAELVAALAGTDVALDEAELGADLDAPDATVISLPTGLRLPTGPIAVAGPAVAASPTPVAGPAVAASPSAVGDQAHDTLLSPLSGELSPVPAHSPVPVAGPVAGPVASPGTGPGDGRPGRRPRPRWLPWAAAGVATAVVLGGGSWALADALGGGSGSGAAAGLAEVRVNEVAAAASSSAGGSAGPATATGPAATAPAASDGPATAATVQAAGSPAARSSTSGSATESDSTGSNGSGTSNGSGAGTSTGSTGEQPAPGPGPGDGQTGGSTTTGQPPGDGLVAVPGVLNMVLADASATLKAAGFSNIPYLYECLGAANLNTVVSQSPAAGTSQGTSDPVNLRLQANNC